MNSQPVSVDGQKGLNEVIIALPPWLFRGYYCLPACLPAYQATPLTKRRHHSPRVPAPSLRARFPRLPSPPHPPPPHPS